MKAPNLTPISPVDSRYLQVLDEFRKEYQEKSGEKHSIPVTGMRTQHMPTWEYVCWLELKLAGVMNIFPRVVNALSNSSSGATNTEGGDK